MAELRRHDRMAVEMRRDALVEGLRDLMRSEGVSQNALATHVGKSQGHVSNILNGHRNPRVATILELMMPLGKTLAMVDRED